MSLFGSLSGLGLPDWSIQSPAKSGSAWEASVVSLRFCWVTLEGSTICHPPAGAGQGAAKLGFGSAAGDTGGPGGAVRVKVLFEYVPTISASAHVTPPRVSGWTWSQEKFRRFGPPHCGGNESSTVKHTWGP